MKLLRAAGILLVSALSGVPVLSSSPAAPAATSPRAGQDPVAVAPRDGIQIGPAEPVVLRAEAVDRFTRTGIESPDVTRDRPRTATFVVTYNGFTAQAQAAFQRAIDIWATQVTSAVPIQITANWTSLGTGILGSAGADYTTWNFSGAPMANVRYHAALANKLAGADLYPAYGDITASFNSDYTNWYLGTDGNTPAGQYDLVTVVLHEVGHGLGFAGSAVVSSGSGSWGGSTGLPTVFDEYVRNGADQSILDTSLFPNPSTALAAQLQGNSLFWQGTNGVSGNNGTRPRMFAPSAWEQGSSYSHLDDDTYPSGNANSLMTPYLGSAESIHSAGPITLGIFRDLGWTTSSTSPTRTVASDFNGDGVVDRAVFRPANGTWYIQGQSSHQLGLAGDIPVAADYNGDHVIDVAVFRPSTGQWFIEGQSTIQWGLPADVPVVGDFNGDGRADAAVYRTSDSFFATWYVRGVTTIQLGVRGDIPVPADYDGDGRTDMAVYRPSDGNWYIKTSSSGFTNNPTPTQWGLAGDIPVTGSFDSDGKADLAVFRPATGYWYVVFSASLYNPSSASTLQLGLPGDVPLALDFTGDGVDEFVVYRPSAGAWYYRDGVGGTTGSAQYGLPGDIPLGARPQLPSVATADFDGDARADMTVFRPDSGTWYTLQSSANYTTFASPQFGLNGDTKVPGDYDGDRKTDVAVYRPSSGIWYFQRSSNGTFGAVQWGLSTDQPVPADYDGDGRTDLAVFRPSTGQWYVTLSSTDYSAWFADQWGLSSDIPVAADYDGDGRADLAVYRPSSGEWYLKLSSGAFGGTITKQWGLPDDVPVPADFDGDGRADLGVYRPSTGQWYTLDALTSYTPLSVQWGLSSDVPVAHDFDGDGRADAAVFRPSSGEWYIRTSSNGLMIQQQWGLPTDSPVVWSKDDLHPR